MLSVHTACVAAIKQRGPTISERASMPALVLPRDDSAFPQVKASGMMNRDLDVGPLSLVRAVTQPCWGYVATLWLWPLAIATTQIY
jgi:hypothetical protein